jgi:hypothetical protein
VKILLKKRIKVQVILTLKKKKKLNKFNLPILSQLKKERNAEKAKNVENLQKIWRNNFGKTKKRLLKE